MMSLGAKSYAAWGQSLTMVTGAMISKQAIFERMNSAWVRLVKKLLERVLMQQAVWQVKVEVYKYFRSVLLQDSTTLHLPDFLSKLFKGNTSKGKTKAVAKLNLVMDILSGKFLHMRWMSFTTTEQALSGDILQIARPGDLVIRDLGYSVLNIFQAMGKEGIYFLSRLRYGVSLLEPVTHAPIKLCKLLKGKDFIDCRILCGKDEKIQVRLVAIKLSPEQAAARRRKAKQDRDHRLNHSQDYYALLDYVIFITNVSEEIWDRTAVAEAYRVRWNIEIVFKSWKSGLNIKNLIPQDVKRCERIESILYLMMLYVVWFQMLIYLPMKWYAEKRDCQISLLKLAQRITIQGIDWLLLTMRPAIKRRLLLQCSYEPRLRRINAVQRLLQFHASLA